MVDSPTTVRASVVAVAALVVVVARGGRASAHPDDYIDETFVYQTVEKHEAEVEAWTEARVARDDRVAGWYTGALEYGLTERWMADIAVQALNDPALHFGRLRLETRYRFADEGAWPVDLATSLEYEAECDRMTGELEQSLTPRLVISKDVISSVNTTLNLDLPVRLDQGGSVSFAYALGIRYPARGRFRVGAEVRHDVRARIATVFPQLWLLPSRRVALVAKLGLGIGLTDAADPWVARLSFELEL